MQKLVKFLTISNLQSASVGEQSGASRDYRRYSSYCIPSPITDYQAGAKSAALPLGCSSSNHNCACSSVIKMPRKKRNLFTSGKKARQNGKVFASPRKRALKESLHGSYSLLGQEELINADKMEHDKHRRVAN